MKKFITDDSFWALFPDAAIGVLAVENVNEAAQLDEVQAAQVRDLLARANEAAKDFLTSDVISENQAVAVWRRAYQRFPTKRGARCAIEALLKRVLHGKPVGTIVPSVDLTNAVSLKYAFPIGVENMDAFEGDLHLGAVNGGEDFLPIGSDRQEPPLPGELAYYDAAGVVCRCWNWRDGQRTCVKEDTTRELIAMECIEPDRVDSLRSAVDELAVLLSRYVGAQVIQKQIITIDNREMVIQK